MNDLVKATYETAIIKGDLSRLTSEERINYYNNLCSSLGLNPLTRPFEYIILQGKLVLYARKDATDQLRKLYGISLNIIKEVEDKEGGTYTVGVRARARDGREDEATGSVSILDREGKRATGLELANLMMRAETKAKRRATLSICGLGFIDETETEEIAKPPPPITQEQIDRLRSLYIKSKDNTDLQNHFEKTLKFFGKSTLDDVHTLSKQQGEMLISIIEAYFKE